MSGDKPGPDRPASPGGRHLDRKSALAKTRAGLPTYKDILIVEDEDLDAQRMQGTLRSIFGYEITMRRATTLGKALDEVIVRSPDIVFLDDHLKPKDNALETIPFLRRCNYAGPIVVVSGLLDKKRRAELTRAGAVEAIHKDDLDSSTIEEAIIKVHASYLGGLKRAAE